MLKFLDFLYRGKLYTKKPEQMSPRQKSVKKYCSCCEFSTFSARDFARHLMTLKHLRKTKLTTHHDLIQDKPLEFQDEYGNTFLVYTCVCGKEYKYSGSLHNHKKKCSLAQQLMKLKEIEVSFEINKVTDQPSLINSIVSYTSPSSTQSMHQSTQEIKMEVVNTVKTILAEETHKITTQIQEMKEAFIDSSEKLKTDITTEFKKEIDEVKAQNDVIMKKPAQINNTINIINFLNTECGQAMTLKEFLDNMVLSMDDIYYTRDNGFVKGMSNAFLRQIENIGYNRRPIHCSDKKRLKFFIKTREGIWMRDSDNTNIQEAVSAIKTKHIQKLEEWKSERPGWIHDPIQSDEYLLMCNNFMEDIKLDGDKKKQALIKAIGAATGLKGESEGGNGGGYEYGEDGGDIIVSTVMDDGITIKEV